MNKDKLRIEPGWTLFLDRDGVINKKLENDYIKNVNEFIFIEGVLKSLSILSLIFDRIVIVTNQQGVGKKLMNLEDLENIHSKMLGEIYNNKGRIDKIYYCTAKREDDSFFRKPNVGMALRAKKDFPEIVFKKSVIAGDTVTDMQFGRKMRMVNVLIAADVSKNQVKSYLYDYIFPDLLSFANNIIY